MNISSNDIVADCVVANYKTAEIFKKYGIDFCCGGKISIKEVCQKTGVSEQKLLEDLNFLLINEAAELEVENLELDLLIDYIIEKHHAYIIKKAPEIESLLDKIVEVHGGLHSELLSIKDFFVKIKNELFDHMKKEENVLFPYIKNLVESKNNNSLIEAPSFITIKNPINTMELEHSVVGGVFNEIRKLSNNFFVPENTCNTYKITMLTISEFEDDLHRHIHLENNILFPKAINLEEGLFKK